MTVLKFVETQLRALAVCRWGIARMRIYNLVNLCVNSIFCKDSPELLILLVTVTCQISPNLVNLMVTILNYL